MILDSCGREPSNIPPPIFPMAIRDHLKIWQGQQNIQNREMLQNMNVSTVERDAQNLMIHSGEHDTAQIDAEIEKLWESEAETHLELGEPLLSTSRTNHFFKRGDVVELL